MFLLWSHFLLVSTVVKPLTSKLIGAAIIPHGDFAYDPSLVNFENGSSELHNACISVAHWIMHDMKPDVIFLSTPHAMSLQNDFLIYENRNESGYAMVGDDLHNNSYSSKKVSLNITSNKELAIQLINILKSKSRNNNNISGILGFADAMPLPIGWGEVLPIKYLQHAIINESKPRKKSDISDCESNYNFRDKPPFSLPEFILFSMPLRRYNFSTEMNSELLQKGRDIWSILNDEQITGSLNVFVIVSADLSHTHLNPYSMPYGNCTCAEPFDISIGHWITTMNDSYLLQNASYQQSIGAMSCGYTGFVLLQGMFDESIANSYFWKSQLRANYHPTYYGMAVANFSVESLKTT